jgi:transcriptional repressor NrdR
MKCPFCSAVDDRVVDSRESREGEVIRRRRDFTSYETIEEIPYMVVKNDGRRERFDRNKLRAGLVKACEKRPVPSVELDRIVDEIENLLHDSEEREIPTTRVGTIVMDRLRELDKVAYVRFASVYRKFEDVDEFMNELKSLIGRGEKVTS